MIGFISQTLNEITRQTPLHLRTVDAAQDATVTGVTYDSRVVRPGAIYVAYSGMHVDGHQFIPQAIAKGAVAVVGSQDLVGLSVPYFKVENPREALAHLSAAFYGYPARKMTMIGVTGTDGKTTTANLLYQILLAAGLQAGVISTVNAVIGDEVVDTGFHVTTPEAPDVQRYLARMRTAGLTHVILETTSHGLVQDRVTGCEFDIGVVTNITHEHLDFHGTYEAYRAAKARLLTSLADTSEKAHGNPRLAVLNRDDPSYEYLAGVTTVQQTAYSLTSAGDVHAEDIRYSPDGLNFTAVGPEFRIPIHSSLLGQYNVSNCLAALSAAVGGLGVDPEAARRGIAALRSVPGRMERIVMGQAFFAIVDFAHTPNALKQTLLTARQMTPGRIIAVFGSAGLRDREKRRLMALTAAGLADFFILTAEDPRTESLEGILEEMAEGACSKGGVEGKTFLRVPDRAAALRQAVKMAGPKDMVIACGKGHEQSMCFGEIEYPWDDRTAMRAALAELLGVVGPEMPFLPIHS